MAPGSRWHWHGFGRTQDTVHHRELERSFTPLQRYSPHLPPASPSSQVHGFPARLQVRFPAMNPEMKTPTL